jgi:hypothetical protein
MSFPRVRLAIGVPEDPVIMCIARVRGLPRYEGGPVLAQQELFIIETCA